MVVKKIKSINAQGLFDNGACELKEKELIFYSVSDCSTINLKELTKELGIESSVADICQYPYLRYDIMATAERGAAALMNFPDEADGYQKGDIIVATVLGVDDKLYGVSAYDDGLVLFNCMIDKEDYSCLPSDELVRVVVKDRVYRLRKNAYGRVDFSNSSEQALLEDYKLVDASLLTIYHKKDLERIYSFEMAENDYIEVIALKPGELTPDKLTDLYSKLRVLHSAGARTTEFGRMRYVEYFQLGKDIAEQYPYPIILVVHFSCETRIVTVPYGDRMAIFNAKAKMPKGLEGKAVAFAQNFETVIGVERGSSLDKRFNILNEFGCRDLGVIEIGENLTSSRDDYRLIELNVFDGELDFADILRTIEIRDTFCQFNDSVKNTRFCNVVCWTAKELYADRICVCLIRHVTDCELGRYILGDGRNFPMLFNAELITKDEDLTCAKNFNEPVLELIIADGIYGNIKLAPGKMVSVGDIIKNAHEK